MLQNQKPQNGTKLLKKNQMAMTLISLNKLKQKLWRNQKKTKLVTKLENSNFDKTHELKLKPNLKNGINFMAITTFHFDYWWDVY